MEPEVLNPGERASVLEGGSHVVEGLSLFSDLRFVPIIAFRIPAYEN